MTESQDVTGTFTHHLAREVNEVVVSGSLIAAILGFGSALLTAAALATGTIRGLEYPTAYGVFCGLACLGLHVAARKGLVGKRRASAVFLPIVLLPTGFFLGAELFSSGGAGSYLTGPYAFVYFVMIVLTGFTFDYRLSRFAGALSAGSYLAAFALGHDELATISSPYPMLEQDLRSPAIYVLRAGMMVAVGYLVGALSTHAKRLLSRVMREEQEKTMISRLFGQYVSDEVREKILLEKTGLSGERREVAVLFSDIRGFSAFSEDREPEEILRHLNVYFDRMVGALTAHGGTVDKFIGDAVMGVFGGVVSLEAPCAAAFDAAVAMRTALATLNAEWAEAGLPTFENGIGLHYGPVVQGPLGSRDRKEFTVVGDAVNTASRAEGLCKEYGHPLLLTRAVYERLRPEQQARCRPLGEAAVKGRAKPVEIFGALGAVDEARASA